MRKIKKVIQRDRRREETGETYPLGYVEDFF
jgi:hypothetical protein